MRRTVEGYEAFEDVKDVENAYKNVTDGWSQFTNYSVMDTRCR